MTAALSPNVMSDPAWIVKWRAREALKNGRPEEAHRLLDDLVAAGNRRAFALRADVVRGYLERAEKALRHEDVEAAWADLARVEQIAPADGGVVRLRDMLTRLGIAEARAALEAGNPMLALQALGRLKERPASSPEAGPMEEAAREWLLASEDAERGEFTTARAAAGRARGKLGGRTAGLDRFEQDLVRREDHFRFAWGELTAAAAEGNWRDLIRLADEVLAVAPCHREAQQARARAWQNVQPETAVYTKPEVAVTAGAEAVPLEETQTAGPEPAAPRRFFLWIDNVGAWLVCLGPRVAVGQATPEGGPVDVPLYADVSRVHASLTRDEESYILETSRDVLVNGAPVTKAVLRPGDRLTVASCPLLFEQPVPGCLSARLTPGGGRRLPMAVDGVLLMADLLVIGPGEKVHVSAPDLKQPLYLFRQKDRLGVRWPGEFTVEGQKCRDRALLPPQGCVSGDGFTFALEPASR
jgi:hypothetical protein